MVNEKTDNWRFELSSGELGVRVVEEPPDFDTPSTVYRLAEQGKYFAVDGKEQIKLYQQGHDYITTIIREYGVTPQVRLIIKRKRPDIVSEDWVTVVNAGVDLRTATFENEPQNESVSFDIVTGGLTQRMEARWDDDIDITADTQTYNDNSDLPFVRLWLESRKIFRRSRIANAANPETPSTQVIGPKLPGTGNGDARTVRLNETIINSDTDFFGPQPSTPIPYASDDFADGAPEESVFYRINDREKVLDINIQLNPNFGPGLTTFSATLSWWLIRYTDGTEMNFGSKYLLSAQSFDLNDVVNFGENDINPFDPIAERFILDGSDPVDGLRDAEGRVVLPPLLAGESLALVVLVTELSNNDAVGINYTDSFLEIQEDSVFPATCIRALKPIDLFDKLLRKQGSRVIGADPNNQTGQDFGPFGPGGKYENILIAHGTWIRQVPQIVNEGTDEERRVQSNISLKFAYEAYSLLEPLRYESRIVGTSEQMYFGVELETQRNVTGIELRDKFGLQEPVEKTRNIISDSWYGSVEIGSNTSGENYGEVNNLFSPCGRAQWSTKNVNSDSRYEVTSDVRTGAEDVELVRVQTFNNISNSDTQYDDDWFLIDARPINTGVNIRTGEPIVDNVANCDFIPIKWPEQLVSEPVNLFDPTSAYNLRFRPSELLFGHSWKISPAIWDGVRAPLQFNSSNCNSSLVTQRSGVRPLQEDEPIEYGPDELRQGWPFQGPTVRLEELSFRIANNPDIEMQLLAENRYGLVSLLWKGEPITGRLLEAGLDGSYRLILAR